MLEEVVKILNLMTVPVLHTNKMDRNMGPTANVVLQITYAYVATVDGRSWA